MLRGIHSLAASGGRKLSEFESNYGRDSRKGLGLWVAKIASKCAHYCPRKLKSSYLLLTLHCWLWAPCMANDEVVGILHLPAIDNDYARLVSNANFVAMGKNCDWFTKSYNFGTGGWLSILGSFIFAANSTISKMLGRLQINYSKATFRLSQKFILVKNLGIGFQKFKVLLAVQ